MESNQELQGARETLIHLQQKKSIIEENIMLKLNSYKYYQSIGSTDTEFAPLINIINDEIDDNISDQIIYMNNNYSENEIKEMSLERIKEVEREFKHDLSNLKHLDNGLNELFMMLSPKNHLVM